MSPVSAITVYTATVHSIRLPIPSPHFHNSLALIQPPLHFGPTCAEPRPQGAVGDVAAAQPDEAIALWRMAQAEVVVLGDQDEAVCTRASCGISESLVPRAGGGLRPERGACLPEAPAFAGEHDLGITVTRP